MGYGLAETPKSFYSDLDPVKTLKTLYFNASNLYDDLYTVSEELEIVVDKITQFKVALQSTPFYVLLSKYSYF